MAEQTNMNLGAIYLRGMAMGAADVVPGVSGGTVALITGIYQRLLDAISAVDITLLRHVLRGQIATAWRQVDGAFLLCLVAGIATSIILFANLITHLLQTQPLLVWSFFFGLIAASSIYLLRQLPQWSVAAALWLLLGAVLAWLVADIRPVAPEMSYSYAFMCGAIAICAMILPGVSGSFMLVLLGAYAPVMEAIKAIDLPLLAVFAAGCAVGILSFAKLLAWLLHHYQVAVMALLTGFLLGSLRMVWPWREVLQTYTSSHGEVKPLVQQNVWPAEFTELTGQPHQLSWCLLAMAVALLLVVALERLGRHPEAT